TGERAMGILNLVGSEQGLFDEAELKMLYGVGNQVAVALERARLHDHLEQLVEERTAALRNSEDKLTRAQAVAQVGSWNFDIASNRLEWSAEVHRIFGIPGQEVTDMETFVSTLHPDDREMVLKAWGEAVAGAHYDIEHRIVANGETRWVRERAICERNAEGLALSGIGTVQDITQRKGNETKIKRLNRIYAVLSGINTTIVRVREENELFREACRIAVEHGRFIFAWIGKLDADRQQVTPVAQAGRDDGYLAQINLTSREDMPGNCALTAQALTDAKPVICNDIASDERMATLRSEALKRGYRSVVVLPLMLEGKPAGVFVLYAPESGVFDDEEMKLLIEMAGDISFAMDNLKKEEKLNYLAYYDAITGLPNRTLFYDRLGQHLHDVRSGEMVAVLAIDLERFRVINETFGRHAGDALLKQVAERLITMGLGVDHLARISADCFAMVLSNIKEEADVVRFLESQVATALSRPFTLEGQELRISARAGIAIFPNDGKDADTLFRNAEAALKKSKLSGDKYLFYTPAFNARAAEKLTLENKLRRALEQEQLVLHYQPKVDLKSNQIGGLEALMRWNDPETGLVPPWKFIPLLEETGMIIEAGAWALAQAMADYRAWQEKGLAPPRIAVNVSQVQLQRKDFVSTIKRLASDFDGISGGLEIEITESLIMQDVEANIQKLHAIREMGVEVAIDDFGTGYSSLSYIAKLPINALKIDRAFIINMTRNADDLSIVSAIISLAHSLNLRVIAEGVETHEQAKLLRLLKCDEIQGFLFSPGVPAEQLEEFLRNKKTLA
ncbi:MAG TPA: EAL domain-containing protein, partial [Rhodoferax sp.]